MPNALTALGLSTATREELVSYYTTQFQQIYGADINLDSSSPDGQLMNIFVQSVLDLQDLLVQVYNTFDPDNAIGNVLDQRVAINGIQRQAGTYTITPITVVTSQSVNLYGVDQTAQPVYTISDNAGNRWELLSTVLGLATGTHVLSFRAALPGANLTIPNTITVPVTIVLGVTSINNPTTYTTLGINEETDAQLKVRRQKSVSIVSQGYLAGLLAALEAIVGMESAFVYENRSDFTDVDGVPGHSIWVIVSGTAAAADIARAIYNKRNAGCGMFGDTTYDITQVDGTLFTVQWDNVVAQNLFTTFVVTSLNGTTPPDIAAIRAGLVTALTLGVNAEVNINQLATLVQEIDPNTLVTGAGFTTGQTQVMNLSDVAASGAFKISYNGEDSAAINFGDATATVQSKVRAVTGLSTVVVTGSITGLALSFDLSDETVVGLLTVTDNTLETAGLDPVVFTYDEGYANFLSPSSKKNQFVLTEADIIITPMQFLPASATVAATETQLFAGLGGYGTLTYSFQTNNSGGTINASTGLYTAGATPSVTDTIKVTDAMGNTATAAVTVTA